MSQESHPEDRTILAAIEALEKGSDALEPEPRDETTETLARLYAEVLGLVPYELDPAAPRPEVKERLMAAIGAADTPQAAPRPAPAPAPVPPATPAPPAPAARASREFPAPVPERAPEPVAKETRAAPHSPAPAAPAPRRPSRWPLLLAASLAIAFAGLSGWLWVERLDQRERIAVLERELDTQRREAARATERLDGLRTELAGLRQKLLLVTAPAVEVSPLRPVGEGQAGGRGLLFVAADHQHWYLSLEGLEAAGANKVYQLWWITPQGPQNALTFIARRGERIEASSEEMPPGTTAAAVTLEDAPGATAPTGPEVMRSAGIVQLL